MRKRHSSSQRNKMMQRGASGALWEKVCARFDVATAIAIKTARWGALASIIAYVIYSEPDHPVAALAPLPF